MLKSADNPEGVPIEAFDQIRAGVAGDRSQFYEELSAPFYGANRPGSTVSQGVRDQFWRLSMQAGFAGAYQCIKAFSETDFRKDLGKIDVPTLVIHGDDDQIVPITVGGLRSSKMIRGATLRVYEGAPHGLMTTHQHRFNADLLDFARQQSRVTSPARGDAAEVTPLAARGS
jgi:non-heme chloroperoxidase